MSNDNKILNSDNGFSEKAAWFSLLAPLSCVLICFLTDYICKKHFPQSNVHLVGAYVCGAALVVQIFSLIMSLFGLGGNGLEVKGIAVIGMILSCIVGLFAGMGLFILTCGMGWSDG